MRDSRFGGVRIKSSSHQPAASRAISSSSSSSERPAAASSSSSERPAAASGAASTERARPKSVFDHIGEDAPEYEDAVIRPMRRDPIIDSCYGCFQALDLEGVDVSASLLRRFAGRQNDYAGWSRQADIGPAAKVCNEMAEKPKAIRQAFKNNQYNVENAVLLLTEKSRLDPLRNPKLGERERATQQVIRNRHAFASSRRRMQCVGLGPGELDSLRQWSQ